MRQSGARIGALVGVLAMTLLSLVWWAVPASAHDELVGSNPADGTTVTALPPVIHLYFEEPPASGYTGATVLGPGRRVLNSGAVATVGSTISVPIHPSKTRGTYRVRYHVLSDDGHVVSGVIIFRLGTVATGPARGGASPSTAASSSSSPGQSLGPVVVIAGALVLAAGAGAMYAQRGAARRRAALVRR
jgi:methionine-rich copper-binding protein CopC